MKGNWKSSLIFTQQEKAEYVGNQQLLIDPSENWGHQQTDWSPTNWRDRLVTTENYNSLERSLGAGSITEPSIWVGEPHLVKHWGLRMNACMLSQSCPALCDPRDCSPPGCSVPGILQARILEWVVISYSRGSSQPRDWTCVSCISCIGGWILYHCTTSESPGWINWRLKKSWGPLGIDVNDTHISQMGKLA